MADEPITDEETIAYEINYHNNALLDIAAPFPKELRDNTLELPESISAVYETEGVVYRGTLYKQPAKEA